MATGTTRAERRRVRTEAILDAALAILLEEGVHELTMRRLARDLGITPGAMYRYFDGKDAILAGVGRRTLGRVAEALNTREAHARTELEGLSPEAAAVYVLLARSWHYFALSLQDPAGWRLINLFLVSPRQLIDDDPHARFMALVTAQLQRVAALAQEAVAAGVLTPANGLDRALAIFATLNGHLQTVKLSSTSGLGFQPEQTVRFGLDSLLAGWGADDEIRTAAWARLDAHISDSGATA